MSLTRLHIWRTRETLQLVSRVHMVTPLHGGPDLMTNEFLFSRIDNDGGLVFSSFTGSALAGAA